MSTNMLVNMTDEEIDSFVANEEAEQENNRKHARNKDYRIDVRERHIERKKRIIKDQNNYWHYKFEGMLDKGKIHCSCWICRRKSYDYPKIQDIKRREAMSVEE